LVKKVQAMIDEAKSDGTVGVNTFWLNVREVLEMNGIGRYELQKPDDAVFHTANRGGLGGNAYDSHKNGDTALATGADFNELAKAVSLELCPLNPLKELQYRFMEMLVAKSKGLFAKVSRSETSGTLGCGHWAQLAKATNAQCVTPFKRLQNADGRIDKSRVFLKDPRFEKMCTEGWKVYKLPFAVQAAWPELPAFIQRALNASNLAVSHPNELETQRTLVEYMQHMDQYSDANWQTACDAVAQTSICKDYMDPVMVLVREHAGGAQCPRLWETTDFQRQNWCDRALG
jgi:hypothetical protein